jgi:hypothetical protein
MLEERFENEREEWMHSFLRASKRGAKRMRIKQKKKLTLTKKKYLLRTVLDYFSI